MQELAEQLKARAKNVLLLAMDFDGVHTDGYVYVDQAGVETVRCSRRDSLGLNMLKRQGIRLVVISKETNNVVRARCEKLQIECFTGVEDSEGKSDILKRLVEREELSFDQVAYIGDDLNDYSCIKYAGIGVTVADGHEQLKEIADVVLTRKGGEHALRELAELILQAKGVPIQQY